MLARGRHHMSIPGPSAMPERVIRAMMRDAPNIYEGELVEITREIFAGLRRVAQTEAGEAIIYIGNGHAGWEASLANTLSRGERILCLVSGRFGHGWADYARRLGLDVALLGRGAACAGAGRSDRGRPARRSGDPSGPRGACRYLQLGPYRHSGRPGGDGRGRLGGALDGRRHRLPGLRGNAHGRLGRRRAARRLAERADDAAGAGAGLGIRARPVPGAAIW